MASSYSSSLRLELIGTGEQSGTWGDTTNRNLGTLLEQAIAGYSTVSMTDANYTLSVNNGTSDESRAAVLNITSSASLTATRNVVCPSVSKLYVVRNGTTGGRSIVFKTSGGTGVTIPNGAVTAVYCDGTNVNSANSFISALTANSVATPLVNVTPGAVPAAPTNGDLWYASNALFSRVDNTDVAIKRRPVICCATANNNAITANSTVTLVNYTASINTGGSFSAPLNTTTGVFTAPVGGFYQVTISGNMYVGGGSPLKGNFYVAKNGATVSELFSNYLVTCFVDNINYPSAQLPVSLTAILSLSANDALNVQVTNFSSAASRAALTFSARLIDG